MRLLFNNSLSHRLVFILADAYAYSLLVNGRAQDRGLASCLRALLPHLRGMGAPRARQLDAVNGEQSSEAATPRQR